MTFIEFTTIINKGLFGTNAIPHFVRGITGHRHMTPFCSDSSAVLNVLWGSINAAVSGILAWMYRDPSSAETLGVEFVPGVMLAVGLALLWSAEDPHLSWK